MSVPGEKLTFVHGFGRGVLCELEVSAQPPTKGEQLHMNIAWTGRPKKRHTNQYRQWVLCTTQHLCDLWNQRILYGLGLEKNSTEFWHFEPGKPPKLIQKLPIGIP
jgi:hypothetical protein